MSIKNYSLFQHSFQKTILFEGSTRPVALLRIGIVFLLWTSWANDFRLPVTSHINLAATLLGISFFASTFLMLIGFQARLVTGWVGITLLIMHAYLGKALGLAGYSYGVHHQYLLVLVTCLLALTPCGTSYSFDRWRAVQKALKQGHAPPPERGALWGTRLIALQVSMVYFWSAYDKTSWAYLSGERLEQMFMYFFFGSDYPSFHGFHGLTVISAVATVLLEYVLSIGLWFSRWRRGLFLAGFLFHALLYYLFNIWVFTALMWLLYLVFLPPDKVHRFLDETAMQT